MKCRVLSALVLVVAGSLLPAQDSGNRLYDELVNKGIPIPDGPTVKLPAPLFKPGQPYPKNESELLEKAAGRKPIELFVRDSVTAPFELTINPIEKAADQRCGQLISLAFIGYGKLDAVKETDFIKSILGANKKKGGANQGNDLLTAKELQSRGIPVVPVSPNKKETFEKLAASLLDKVQIDGVTYNVQTNSPRMVISTTRLDDRFKNDKDYPNQWRPINKAAGNGLGNPTSYSGLGGYVVATELTEPKGALLIEMQFILNEPPDWFGGPNLLRSKMPTVIQDNVRSFRRKLRDDSK